MRRDLRLRERRERLGMTQQELGEMVFPPDNAQAHISNVEHGRASRERVLEVRKMLIWLESRPHREAETTRREVVRVRRQRMLWAAVPDSLEKRALAAAMADHATALLHDGQGEAFDTLVEWLPEAVALAAGERYCDEVMRPQTGGDHG